MSGQGFLFFIGLAMVFLGFIIIFISFILPLYTRSPRKTKSKGGGVILIGPLPIVFGSNRETLKWMMLLAFLLMAIAFVFMFLPIFLR